MTPQLAAPEPSVKDRSQPWAASDVADRDQGNSGQENRGQETLAVDQPQASPDRWAGGLDWPVVIWIVVVHLGALAAPFVFTWKALALCAFLCWFTGSIGVCMGYHRYLTHGSFATSRPMRWLLALIGGLQVIQELFF